MRLERGLTQVQLAERAHVTRLTVIAVEKGSESVSASAYVDVACALGAELTLIPARMPTMEEARKLFADE
ncbi:MAG: helix-turn-helix transcriptional regulator [Proteobacteria bacterium]|nr:helix-turn-helix transcriptional regulator [Pseudomonadota bacterium]